MTTILITNADGQLASRVAAHLAACEQVRLIGMGSNSPMLAAGGLAAHSPPLNGYPLADLLRREQVDVVVHLDIAGEEPAPPGSEATMQQDVLGSMLLLGACARAGVQRVVLRSSTLVYGAYAHTPAFISEDWKPARPRRAGLIRNYIETEAFAADFARKHPHLQLVILRCAALVGGGIWSPFARYLSQPEPRMLSGFNPRMQVLHPDDAAAAFALAALTPAAGAYNLAAADPLTLQQMIRLAGKRPAPVAGPLLEAAAWFGQRRALLGAWPFEQGYLRYACVAETRRAREQLRWQPHHRASEIVRELSTHHPPAIASSQPASASVVPLARHEGNTV